jgi:hypothetical protein
VCVLRSIARLLHIASVAICLISAASFALFVINQTSTAAAQQRGAVNGEAASGSASGPASASDASREGPPRPSANGSSARSVIDDLSSTLASPFNAVTAGVSSEWGIRISRLLLALLVYGFVLGYLARVIGVRA